MSNLIAYIRKNIVFVSLLSILLVITIGAGIFLWINQQATITPVINTPDPEPAAQEEETTITSLEGSYTRDGQVRLSWSIHAGTNTIESVKLYHKEKALGGEMKALTSYSLSQSLYQFPTGDTTFTLKVSLANGEVISKDVHVFIDYIIDMNMTYEQEGDRMIIRLAYRYDDANPVSVPRIKFLSSSSLAIVFSYMDTTRESTQGITTATTSFSVDISNVPQGSYTATIRWIFDGINISKDYPITITR